jgi:hypothetical protein
MLTRRQQHMQLIILSHVGVWLLDGVWIEWLDSLTPYTHHSELQVNTVLPRISALYSSLLETLVSSVYYSPHYRFLATDFNTGTITVSLNHTLQISLYYITHKGFSSPLDFQLLTELSRFFHHLPILCCNCHLFSIIFDCLLKRLLQLFSLYNLGAAPTQKTMFLTILLLLRVCSFPREPVYRVVA